MSKHNEIFTEQWLNKTFAPQRTEDFFEALFGGEEEGAYDIQLAFVKADDSTLEFALNLIQRPGKCLACNLTYGLPQVFARHPIINIKGIVNDIVTAIAKDPSTAKWELKNTQEVSKKMHLIPLIITL